MARLDGLKRGTPWIYAGIVTAVVVIYSPVIFISYAFEDSYRILADALQGQLADELQMIVKGGRPLTAAFTRLAFEAARGVGDLGIIRAFGVIGIGVLCAMVFRTLCGTRLPIAVCIAAALLFGLTPPLQVYASWAVAAIYPWACALAGAAFIVSDGMEAPRLRWPHLAGSVALLTASLAIYQPAAMVFWNFAAIAWLLRPQLPAPRAVLASVAVMVSSLVLEYGITKLLPRLLYGPSGDYSRIALSGDYAEKLTWFFQEPLSDSLNLFRIDATPGFAIGAALFIVIGLLLFFGRDYRQTASRMAMAACLIPLTYLPNLLVSESWSSYRTQVALTGLIFIYLVAAAMGWLQLLKGRRLVPVISAAAVMAGALTAMRNVTVEFAAPAATEYNLIESALLKMKFSPTDKICFHLPRGEESFAPDRRYDEFGLLSSSQAWVPAAMAWLILSQHRSPYAPLFLPTKDDPPANTVDPGCKEIDLDAILSHDASGDPAD